MPMAPDVLFNLRNSFYLGAYQAAINNSDIPNLTEEDLIERDCLVYRSYIALGSYQLVINEVDSSAATPLQAVKLLALYLSSPDSKESTISSIKEWLADDGIGNNPILRLIAGTIFMHEQDYNEALKHTNAGGTMELLSFTFSLSFSYLSLLVSHSSITTDNQIFLVIKRSRFNRNYCSFILFLMHYVPFRYALNVHIFLKMHRSDYAEKQLRVMQQIDEDHTLTQLATAWLNLAVGGSKIQEAYLIFQDFSEKYQMTSLILNGKAVCSMHMATFDEAESFLLEALNKDAKDRETLANLVLCSLHLGKPSSRFLSQLKLSDPEHMLLKRGLTAEENFNRAIQTVA